MSDSGAGDLSRTMAELARSLSGPRTLDERLRAVTAAVVELMPHETCAGILLISGGNKFETVAPTSELLRKLDHAQQQLGQGPCVAAALNNLVVRSEDLRSESRWPQFAAAAVDVGILSSMSFQLYTSEGKMGALNLFAFSPNASVPTRKQQARFSPPTPRWHSPLYGPKSSCDQRSPHVTSSGRRRAC